MRTIFKMTRERAIEILEHELKWGRNDDGVAGIHDSSTLDALEMAIAALKSDTDFCPHCGAKMKGGD